MRSAHSRLRCDALEILGAALTAVDPERLTRLHLQRWIQALPGSPELPPPDSYARIWLAALGKAAEGMVRGAMGLLDVGGGVGVGPQPPATPLPQRVRWLTGEHPLPGLGSLAAGRALLDLAAQARHGDLFLVLISGGGSALAVAPARHIPPGIKLELHRFLLGTDWDIGSINACRTRFSLLKGGGLAAAAVPADVLSLALLDVPRHQAWACASGPTLPLPSQAGMSGERLNAASRRLPENLRRYLPRDAGHRRASGAFVIIGHRGLALGAAARQAVRMGYQVRVQRRRVRQEATRLGLRLGHEAAVLSGGRGTPFCILRAGEPVVRLPADAGSGGRCQQVALAAALQIEACAAVVLAAGSDGRDGPGLAAGGLVDGGTTSRIGPQGQAAEDLARHNASPALATAGDLVFTGPTGTNVGDLFITLVGHT